MKKILNICLSLLAIISSTLTSKAQIEIVIVASSHNNSYVKQNLQLVVDKLKSFKPDMVFGEYLPAADYAKLEDDNWAKIAFKKKLDYINKLNPEPQKKPASYN